MVRIQESQPNLPLATDILVASECISETRDYILLSWTMMLI